MSKFIRISKKELTIQDIVQAENFIEQQQRRLIEWRKVDIVRILLEADLSGSMDEKSIHKIYYGISKLIIDIQSELMDIQRNFSHAKSLATSPHNSKASNDIEQAFNNFKQHIESYQEKIKQIQAIWSALMKLAQVPQENLFL